eukprot:scaffold294_cov221-Amphora_coffeaeformis.AAC.50
MSQPPPNSNRSTRPQNPFSQPRPSAAGDGGSSAQQQHQQSSSSSERIAIENVELLEADHQRRQYNYQQQPPSNNPNFVYGGPMPPPPVYGMPTPPPPSHAYYGSTGQQQPPPPPPQFYHNYPPPPQPNTYVQAAQNRRSRSAILPSPYKDAEAAAIYPTEYQPLVQPPPHRGVYGAMASDPAGVGGSLTLDDIERSFNHVVNQQYQQHHHRAMSTSDIPPPPQQPFLEQQQQSQSKPNSRGPSPRPGQHRRAGSWTGNPMLPPLAGAQQGRSPGSAMSNRKRADSAANRSRTNSGTFLGGSAAGAPRGHRRSWSRASSTDLSVVSQASMVSVVSDISKSAFFGGVTDAGQVQMHYPTERVRIIMQPNLPRGQVYMHPIDPAAYEAYHVAAEESQHLQWEHVEDGEEDFAKNPHKSLACHCRCGNCAGCTGKRQLLPVQHFVINVPDDIYRRLLDEICASADMPCGLYFCGHHEDVSTPSIGIALMTVVTLMLLMGSAAYYFQE